MLRVGCRVQFVGDKTMPFYPHSGTFGTVKRVGSDSSLIQWDKGVEENGIGGRSRTWFCNNSKLKETDDYANYNLIQDE